VYQPIVDAVDVKESEERPVTSLEDMVKKSLRGIVTAFLGGILGPIEPPLIATLFRLVVAIEIII